MSLEYGDDLIDVEVPDTSVVVDAAQASEPTPLADPVGATRAALDQPLGSEPVKGLVGPGSTVTIAFPDRVKGGAHETAHRRTVLPLLLDDLFAAGVRPEDVRLVCAIGLHRKNRPDEIEGYLGDAVHRVPAQNVVNHDAEDPDGIVDLGTSSLGDPVAVNRHVVESDLSILIGHAAGNPYGGFSGGYKMPSTGLTTWRSIASHHTPRSLYRDDFVPVSPHSHFRDQLRAIGQRIEEALPQPFFSVDAVLDSANRQLGVAAGLITDVEQATWPLAAQRTDLDVGGPDHQPADVLLIGVPRTFHYGPGMGSNPILLTQAIGASVIRAKKALVDKPVVIAAAVCDGWFNLKEFPPYEAVYDVLATCQHPADMKQHEELLATDPHWVELYRHHQGYHPFHAFSMVYMGGVAREQTLATFVAGARRPDQARVMGHRTTATVEEALREAAALLGREPRVVVVPQLSKPQFHLVPRA
ncbi:lactate racemase domain-containing protein [Nocardioides mangrovicus]|uniref:lactate racemase domain-containing protein n=1 Tax=Nocardioides mangrovicus TaxID=2478913 RepID=UPI0013140612|nr:lactate racemase domain-containing protein [Nocardioides mangrovicus]